MRKIFAVSVIVILSLLIIPLKNINVSPSAAIQTSAKPKTAYDTVNDDGNNNEPVIFKIKTDSGIISVPEEEYLIGVVAAEMPVSYGIEALKAQSVAAYSFALCRKEANKDLLYDLTDSFRTDQSYLSFDTLKEKWGENYESNMQKISSAVKQTYKEKLTFDGQTALTLYHSVSSGMTNDCADVFGGDRPYLVSVLCEEDKLSGNYKSFFSFTEDEIKQKLSSVSDSQGKNENLFSDPVSSKSGFVKSIKYAGKETEGSKIAQLLSLNSATFTVTFSENTYTFCCLGYGHGVGMSQYAAGKMAENGSDYKEILSRFYPGTVLEKTEK